MQIIGKAPFKCPVCRAVFEVEEEKQKSQGTTAASSLPINHFASTVLAAALPSSSSGKRHADPNNVVCEGCEENQAIEFCKDCSQSFCDTCKKPHLKAKVSAHHQFISLDEGMKPGSGSARGLPVVKSIHNKKSTRSARKTSKQSAPNASSISTRDTKLRD